MAFRPRTACVLTAFALSTLAACGGGDKDSPPAAQSPSTPAQQQASSPSNPGTAPKAQPKVQPKDKAAPPTSRQAPYLNPPAVGRTGAVCGTAVNDASAEYALKVARGQVKCSEARTAFTNYFGYVRAREAAGYGYDGRAVKIKGGWICRPHAKGDVTGRSIDCVKSGSLVNATVIRT
ncbi:hypothetical protein [Actinomadura rudentiformis]|uniref:Serine/threonine protein kinase n=1 Tax=Actinomadura rudentiformis TaxID=359158 RepID=A0A6H9YU04_9ACTN|nr:hypothetical protein [Actinomadura rudentiformis]KAB2344027.1 hypothetical protein F8566_32355 [Actinomadura rudentiformis]